MKIGILGFQGAVIEHQRHIEQLGQEAVVVRYTEQLAEIDGIILPGGESTTTVSYTHLTLPTTSIV